MYITSGYRLPQAVAIFLQSYVIAFIISIIALTEQKAYPFDVSSDISEIYLWINVYVITQRDISDIFGYQCLQKGSWNLSKRTTRQNNIVKIRNHILWGFLDFWLSKKNKRLYLKFCFYNRITITESMKMLQKYFRESTLSRTQIFDWIFEAFIEER